jgi:hypothetical protein
MNKLLDMKTMLLLFALSHSVIPGQAQTFTIAGETFHPFQTNLSVHVTSYVPTNQTRRDWTKFLAIRYGTNHLESPKRFITQSHDSYQKRNPGMTATLTGDESKNQWYVDYIDHHKMNGSNFLAWVFWRAEPNASGGILVVQYEEQKAYNISDKELEAWDIKGLRAQMIPILVSKEFKIE